MLSPSESCSSVAILAVLVVLVIVVKISYKMSLHDMYALRSLHKLGITWNDVIVRDNSVRSTTNARLNWICICFVISPSGCVMPFSYQDAYRQFRLKCM